MQCLSCIHQHRRFRAVDGSITFVACAHPLFSECEAHNNAERELLHRICLRDAGRGDCLQFEPIVLREGQYMAEDHIPPVPASVTASQDGADGHVSDAAFSPSPRTVGMTTEPGLISAPLPIEGGVLASRI